MECLVDYEQDLSVDYEQDLSYEIAINSDSFYKNDGWWTALLLLCLVFGPRTSPGSALPPMRFTDFVIAFMLIGRWRKTRAFYGGFLFSRRIRIYSGFMFALAGLLLFSTFINVSIGTYSFFIKDLYIPFKFLRSVLIAAITATFTFGPKQTKQLVKGILFVTLLASVLSFVQKFSPYLLSGIVERFYAIDYTRLEIATRGNTSRVVGTFGNPNSWGSCLVMLGTASVASFLHMKGSIKFAAILVYITVSMAIIATTGSRTSFLAIVAVTIFSAILSFRGKSIIWILLGSILFSVLLLFVKANIDSLPINPRLKTLIKGERTIAEGLAGRNRIWKRSLSAVKGSYLIGTGGSTTTVQLSDNGYLMMLLRTGVIGLVVYLLMLARLSVRGVKAFLLEKESYQRTIMLMSLMVFVCHLLFEVVADFLFNVQYMGVLGIFIGLMCGLSRTSIDNSICDNQDFYQEDQY